MVLMPAQPALYEGEGQSLGAPCPPRFGGYNPAMNAPLKHDQTAISDLLEEHQRMLYGYIRSLVNDAQVTGDILQETNLVIWSKADEFEQGTNFKAWTCRIAYFEVLRYFEKQKRDRLRFNSSLMESLAKQAETRAAQHEATLAALQQCLKKLPEGQQRLIEQRYTEGASLQAIAEELKRTAASLAVTIHRIRRALMKCIQAAKMASGHEDDR